MLLLDILVPKPRATSTSRVDVEHTQLRVATANVLTWSPSEFKLRSVGLNVAARASTLEDFRVHDLDVIGIQEGRIPGPARRTGDSYEMFVGECSGGVLGCQIWVRRELTACFSFAFESPNNRIAALWASSKATKVVFLAVHAPHAVAQPDERDAFFAARDAIVDRAVGDGWRVIELGDFNARTGSSETAVFR